MTPPRSAYSVYELLPKWLLGWPPAGLLVSLCLFLAATPSAFADTRDIQSRWVSAISADNVSVLRALLDESNAVDADGANENKTANANVAPLWTLTASNGKTALMVASKVGDVALAKRLVDLGSNIQDRTITNGTAFMFAVLGDQTSIAQWLVGLGADINAKGSNGWTSVMIASAKGLDGTLGWLLSEGANAQTPDVYGFSPLMRAADNGHAEAVRLLLGKDVPAGDDTNADTGLVDVHWQDELENTALHYAVAGSYQDIVQLLLDADADVKIKNRAGLSALDMAISTVNDAKDSAVNRSVKQDQKALLEI